MKLVLNTHICPETFSMIFLCKSCKTEWRSFFCSQYEWNLFVHEGKSLQTLLANWDIFLQCVVRLLCCYTAFFYLCFFLVLSGITRQWSSKHSCCVTTTTWELWDRWRVTLWWGLKQFRIILCKYCRKTKQKHISEIKRLV